MSDVLVSMGELHCFVDVSGSRVQSGYFFSIPSVGLAALLVAQQNTESLPQASHVCLTSSFQPNPAPVVVMVDLQPGQ